MSVNGVGILEAEVEGKWDRMEREDCTGVCPQVGDHGGQLSLIPLGSSDPCIWTCLRVNPGQEILYIDYQVLIFHVFDKHLFIEHHSIWLRATSGDANSAAALGCPVHLQTPEAEKGWHLQEDAVDMCDNSENSGDTSRTSTILPPMGMITYLKVLLWVLNNNQTTGQYLGFPGGASCKVHRTHLPTQES